MVLSQVAYKADELPIAFEQDLAHRELHGKRGAILALADNDAPHTNHMALASGEITRQIAVVVLTMRRRHQHAHIPSLHLAAGKAEEALRVAAEGLDEALVVDDY